MAKISPVEVSIKFGDKKDEALGKCLAELKYVRGVVTGLLGVLTHPAVVHNMITGSANSSYQPLSNEFIISELEKLKTSITNTITKSEELINLNK